ncbi:MAG: hypothetical protein GX556_09755, partial [Fibrobacter sp.]|nr:hypothetical protein [Fibrobacter sp.]
ASQSGAEKQTTYISQSYVDSLVDRAFYIFNSVSDPASGIPAERAVEYGKQIAAKLREIARDDVNKKYILWRTGELEAQIYLEESGLLLEKEQFRAKESNELVMLYNAEIGKGRPDFMKLWGMHGRMKTTDTARACTMEKSIVNRASALSREIPSAVEIALENGEYESARGDLTYCEANRQYLSLSSIKLASLQAKLLSDFSLSKERLLLKNDFDSLSSALVSNRLPESRSLALKIRNRLDGIQKAMLQLEWSKYNDEYLRLSRKTGNKEDSLLAIVQSRLKSQGIVAAEEFLDTLRLHGVSREKMAKIDRIILEEVIARKKTEPSIVKISIVEDTSEASVLNDLLAVAKKRVAMKKDSLASQRNENARLTQTAEVRRDRMRVALEMQQKRQQERMQENTRRARQELIAVYTLLESGKEKDALAYFQKVRELLEENLSDEEFKKVNQSVSLKNSNP